MQQAKRKGAEVVKKLERNIPGGHFLALYHELNLSAFFAPPRFTSPVYQQTKRKGMRSADQKKSQADTGHIGHQIGDGKDIVFLPAVPYFLSQTDAEGDSGGYFPRRI